MANLKIGDKALPFELKGVDNQKHALSDFDDKEAVVVFFSCNHCPYVLAWEDRLMKIQEDYQGEGVQLIAINANDAEKYPTDSFPNMQVHAEQKGFNFPYLYDESQEIAHAYGAERTPEVFVFDADRVLRYHGTVDDNHEDASAVTTHYLREALEAVVSGETPKITNTEPRGCTIKWK